MCSAVVTYTAPTGTDNCPGATTAKTAGLGSGSTFPVGTTTETYTVTDAAGNTASCSFTVTVNDTEAPSPGCPAAITQGNDPGDCSAVVTFTASPTDNCPGVTYTASPASGSTFAVGTSSVTVTATDAAGNTSMCSFNVTVNDIETPSASCPGNLTVNNDAGMCSAVVTFSIAASDNCPGVTTSASPASGTAFPVGTTIVTGTATDGAGNMSTCTFNITVNDNENPTITCPANVTQSVNAAMCSANVTVGAPTVTDNCSATATNDYNNGADASDNYPLGTTTVTWTATDGAGNTATCTHTVTVTTDLAADAGMDTEVCDGSSTAIGGAPTASGGGGGPYSYLWDNAGTLDDATLANPTATPTATTTYTVTVTDNFGCTATDQVTVTVNPNPTASISGVTPMCSGVTLTFDGNPTGGTPGYTHSWSSSAPAVATVSDNGDGTADVSAVAGGTTTITYTVTDSKGCTGTATFTLNVPMSCDPEFAIHDPCECIDDADVNGDNGTFREVVVVTGPGGAALPPGQTWTVDMVNGLHQPDLTNNAGPNPAMVTVGQTLIYCNVPGGCDLDGDPEIEVPQGGYYLYGEHVDNQGYSVNVEGPAAVGTPTNVFLHQDNLCFYPEPQILGIQDLCENAAPITLTGAVSTTGTGTFNGNAFYLGPGYAYNAAPGLTDNGNGTATFDPGAAGPGCHTISYTFTDNASAGTAEPGCVSVIEAQLFVYPYDNPTFSVTAPNCPGDVKVLSLANPLAAWPTMCSGTAPSNGERVRWYGGDGVNVTVADNGGAGSADATGTLTISATAVPGTYTVCAEAGVDPCKSTYCFDVVVSPNYTAANADLIPNTTICLSPNEVFDFYTLLASGSSLGGTFTAVTGGAVTGTILPNGFVYGSGDGTLTVTYTLTNCDGSTASDNVTLTIDEMPDGAFSLPTSVCQDAPNAAAVITGVPAGATVGFTSNPAGFIVNATTGEFDASAGPVAGESVNVDVTMTVSNGVCPNHTFDQYVVVNASGDPAFTLQNTICQSDMALSLSLTNANNDGGQPLLADNITWTGTGVTDNGITGTFDPSGLTPGDYTICVTVGSPACEETQCHDIEVQKDYTAAEVALTADFSLCMQPGEVISFSDLLAATALPGGQFTVTDLGGLGIANANNWQYLGGSCGSITVTYSFANDCNPNSDAVTIAIEERPDIGGISNVGPLCATDAAVNMDYTGTPSVCGTTFGTFFGPGVTDNGDGATASFNPATAGEGTHTILYTLFPPSGICSPVVASTTVQVRASSDPTFTLPDEVCIADGPWTLTLDNPDASVNAGSPDGESEVVWYGALGTVDVTDNTGNDPTGSFHPSQPGTYTICVTTGDPDCAQTYCQDIIVHEDAVIPTTCYTGTVGVELPCAADNTGTTHTYNVGSTTINSTYNIHTFDLEGLLCPGTTTGGTWSFNVANANGAILGTNLYYTAPGCYMVEYTVDKPGTSCDATQVFVVRIGEDPQPGLDIPEEWCWDGGDGDPVVTFNVTDYITSPTYLGTVTRSYSSSNPAAATVDPATGVVTATGWGQSTICMIEVLETAACGGFNASTCTNTICQVINVQDNVNPDAECKDIVVDLDAAGNATITTADINNSSSDNCDQTLTMSLNNTAFTCADLGYNMVILTVTDDNSNSDQCMAQVLVRDVTAPTLVCPTSVRVELSADGKHVLAVADYQAATGLDVVGPDLSATDACGPISWAFDPSIVYCEDAETTVNVVITASDGSGNTSTCTVGTLVDDVTPPPSAGMCHDITIEFDHDGNASIMPDDVSNFVDDECGQVTLISVSPNSWSGCVSVGTHAVTVTYDDGNGNTSTCGAQVTIEDNLNPDLECKSVAVKTLDPTSGCVTFDTSGLIVNLYDNCGIQRVDFQDMMTGALSTTTTFCCADLGLNSVIIKATDNNNNFSYCTVTIDVQDVTAPTLTCPANASVSLNPAGTHVFTNADFGLDGADVFDNCTSDADLLSSSTFSPDIAYCEDAETTVNVVITITDNEGNSTSCTVPTFVDDVDPAASICHNLTISLDASGNASIIPEDIASPVDDNCGLITLVSAVPNTFNCTNVGANTVVLTYTDNNGNNQTCNSTVTVVDDIAPVIHCISVYTLQLDGTGNGTLTVGNVTDAASTDACGIASEVLSQTAFNCTHIGLNAVQLTVTDVNGNVSTCDVVIEVVDQIAPTLTCPTSATVNLSADGTHVLAVADYQAATGLSVVGSDLGATDNCDADPHIAFDPAIMYCEDAETTVNVVVTATDDEGNTSTCTIATFVDDVTPPPSAGMCHDITIEFDYLGNASIMPDDVSNFVDDECGQVTLISVSPNTWSGCVAVGTHSVTVTYDDGNGNLSTCGAIVTIEDNLKPDLECKASANVILDATTGCTTIDTSGLILSLYDNCGIERVDFQDMMTGALSQTVQFCCDDLGLNSVTIKAKDNNNNISYCTVVINVIDDTAPVIDCTPVQRTKPADAGVCSFTMPGTGFDIQVTQPDNCPPVTITHNYPTAPSTSTLAGATFPVGITIVDWVVVDNSGNESFCSVEIVITDDEAPTNTTCPSNITASTSATSCGAVVSYAVPTFADNCDGTGLLGTLTNGYAPGTEFPLGTTTVTWQYTDLAGNGPATCTFTVTVNDDVNPVAMCQNNYTVALDEDGNFEILVADINVASWDNCGQLVRKEISRDGVTFGGSVFVDCNDAGNSVTVTLEVEDQSGNKDQCVTIVQVFDDQVPDIECPGNFTVLNDAGQCSAVVNYDDPSVTDNCSYTVTQTDGTGLTSGSAFPVGTTVQSYQVVDASGNSESCSFNITVLDEEPPTVDCAPLVRTKPNDAGLCSFTMPGTGFDATASDNCPNWTFTHDYGPAVSNTTLAGSTFPVGITEVVWTATDAAGNHTSCTVTIVINDTEAPTNTSCPANIAQGTDADACGADVTYALPTFADNCDGTGLFGTLTSGYASGTQFPIGTTTVTWQYTDLAGNGTATCTFTVTITDDDAPTAQCQLPFSVALDGDGLYEVLASDVDLNSIDNCDVTATSISRDGATFGGSVFVDCNDIGGTGFGNVTVTLQVADAAGNTSQCTTIVTVFDLQVPDIECPGNFTVLTDQGACSAVVTYNAPSVTDNCSTTVVQTDGTGLTSGSSFPVGTTVQSYMVTDVAGNTESCSFEITVIEEESPVIDCGPTVRTVSADSALCSFTMPGAGFDPTATDNCPGVVITHNYASAVDPHTLAGSTFPVGSTLVTWIAQDASGNTSDICGIEIIVVDDQNPTISCGADQSVSTDAGECSYKVNNTAWDPAYTDNCPDAVLSHDYAMAPNSNTLNGATFPVGTTTVTFVVTDASGNTATCSMDVTVTDNEAPVYVNCPVTMVMIGNDPDECSGKLNWSIPVAEDNCGIATNEQTGGLPSGSVVPVGTASTVTYTATDVHGNTATCSFDIMVVDTQDPEFDADIVMPGDITVECDAVPAAFVLTNDDVHDNCTAPADLVIVFTETSTQDADVNVCGHYNYTITRTWEITDEAGNTTTHVQIITVQDTQAPVPSCTDQTLTLDLYGNATLDPVVAAAGTTDNCAPFSALTITASQTAFDCDDLGTTQVTITITDPCGNTATCTITVTVVEGDAPCTPEYDVDGSDPCVCLNNATDLSNGQFSELIQIHALAGQTWSVVSSTGLYMASSPAPPAAPVPIANGTLLTPGDQDGLDNDGDGNVDEADEIQYYTLAARHVDAQGFMATLGNNIGDLLEYMNTCYYPTPLFTNLDQDFCLSTPPFEPEVTDQYAGNGAYNSVVFTVNGVVTNTIDPGALGIGNHVVTATVDAGTAQPSRKVNGVPIPGDATGTDGRLDPGCEQTISTFINVVTTPSQVTCNNLVQVSIEQDCESEVTPDMVLEGTYPCFDDYSVVIKDAAGVPLDPPNIVTAAHATQTLTAYLVHPISGNVCWGMLLIEDKLPPVLTCPDDVTIMCTEDPDATNYLGELLTGEPGVDECSNWSRQYTDDYTQYDCADNPGIAEVIVRTFVVSDEFGNQSTCTHTITMVRGEADQVVWPSDKDYNCTSVPGSLDPNVTGWPQIAGFNLTTTGTGICGLGVSYVDQTVNLCPGSYKIVRTWTIFDWCPAQGGAPTQTSYVQYIKILDLPPSISVTCNDVDPATGYCILNATEPPIGSQLECRTFGPIPYAQIDGVCNDVVEVTVETPAGNTINGGYIPGDGLPLGGPYEIVYRAEDECGNITEYTLTVIVQDIVAPTVVCDEITDANLSIDGIATIFAETFDDGTTDNCCLDHFEVRRMEDNCDDGHDDTVFGESVVFCCNDIPGPHTVVFRAYDCHGNYNECMVQVNVSDKLKPDLLSCPAPQRVLCDWYADNLETQLADLAGDADAQSQLLDQYFGTPTFQDNCDLEINRTISINIDQCLEGTITRSWTAEDPSGNVSNQCTQTVFVDHVSDWVVEFPANILVTCGNEVPDFGEPEIFYETCELVAVSYVDEVFNTVPDACYKILRTWTVINWCVVGDDIDEEVVEAPENALGLPFPACDLDGDGDCDDRTFRDSWNATSKPTAANATDITDPDTDLDSDPWDGFITYQQTIKVIDDVDPVFTNGCDIPNVCIEDNTCGATVTLPQPEITECSSIVTLSASGDLGNGFGPFVNVAPGTYSVTYNAIDNCNNQTNCEATVTVEDCKKPTPYCVNGLVIDLMNTVPAMVEVWASDFDAGSFDNCDDNLELSLSADVNDKSRTYTCDDLGQQIVQLWVTDDAGNQDYCETFIIIQANMGQCDTSGTPIIAGVIETEGAEPVADVDVQLSGSNQSSMMTTNDGQYGFAVTPGGDYTVTPVKDVDPLNGVTTFDLVLITKHILGVQELDSPYKMIAADANKSNSITTFDLVQLRKLILFIDTEFPANTSWRFVDKAYVFPDPTDPWVEEFPEVINFNNVTADELDSDFIAVKIGDVNGSAQPNFASGAEDRTVTGSLVFDIDDVEIENGELYTVNFKAHDFNVLGYQFTLNYDRTALEFVEVVPALASTENFGLTLLDKGAITTSWNENNVNLEDGEVVFSLTFKANRKVKLSEALSVNSRFTPAEAYKPNGDLLDVDLAFNGELAGAFELYQNTPNPFSAETLVSFNLPQASTATLTITDVSGKVVKVITGEYAKGYNEIKLKRSELPAGGIYYYQLDTPTDSATKMMLLVD